jgi:DNA (cytosine-5)-methyltransferase 1
MPRDREALLHRRDARRPKWEPGRPVVADVFCCEGGMAEGLWLAGFNVIGFDIDPQPNYPFEFNQADALEILADKAFMWQFDAVHTSPPCQAKSDLRHRTGKTYPELIKPVQELLDELDMPFIIENVEGADELRNPAKICGASVPGVRVIRHRYFETNWPLEGVDCPRDEKGNVDHPLVFTHDKRKAHHGRLDQDTSYVQVTGGGNCTIANKRDAMGTPWMSAHGCNEAVPPAYGEIVGRQLMTYLDSLEEVAA